MLIGDRRFEESDCSSSTGNRSSTGTSSWALAEITVLVSFCTAFPDQSRLIFPFRLVSEGTMALPPPFWLLRLGALASLPSSSCLRLSTAVQAYATAASSSQKFVQPASGAKKGKRAQDAGGTPRQAAVIQMLTRPEAEKHLVDHKQAESKSEAYRAACEERHAAWQADAELKLKLQRDALKALPAALRAKAGQPDLNPFPPNRRFLYDTPPSDYLASNSAVGSAGSS